MVLNKKDADREVVDLINLTNMCREFSTLPRDGGLLDQDQLLVRKMVLVLQAQEEHNQREQKKNATK